MKAITHLRKVVRNRLAARLGVPEIPTGLDLLKRQGFIPELVFDVGAYRGEFARACLARWPRAAIACFDAQPEAIRSLKRLADSRPNISVHSTLLGEAKCAEVPFHEAETASSVLAERQGPGHKKTTRPMTTVDHVTGELFSNKSPNLLKLDVQGYELQVLKGAVRSLPSIEVVLSEVNLLDIHLHVPLLADIVSWLDERDFVAYDICGLTRRPLDGALWQTDIVFVKRDSAFRQDKRWQSGPAVANHA